MGCLLTRRRQLVEMLTAEHNRLLQADDDICPGIETHVRWLEEALSKINEYVDNRIKPGFPISTRSEPTSSLFGLDTDDISSASGCKA
jgi:hypothetical protein